MALAPRHARRLHTLQFRNSGPPARPVRGAKGAPMKLATLLCAALCAAQPVPRPQTAEPLVPGPGVPGRVPQAPSAGSSPDAGDEIPLAGADADAVRVPSSPDAWGGIRSGSEPTLSQRVADYRIEAVLDPQKHTVEGKERLTWRNR